MRRVAVITDIHGNLPAWKQRSRDRRARDRATYCGGDLVGYGPWPNEVCRLIAERGIPTIYGNYDYAIARDEEDCGCAYVTRTTASSASARSPGPSSTPTTRPRNSCSNARSTCASSSAASGCVWSTARRARSTSTSSRTSRRALSSGSPPAPNATCSSSATPTSPGSHTYGDVLFVNCGSVGKPKDGDPRGGFAVLEASGGGVEAPDRALRLRRRARRPRGRGCRAAQRVRREAVTLPRGGSKR